MDDFKKMDNSANEMSGEIVKSSGQQIIPSDMTEYRSQLIEKYHGGESSLVERLEKDGKTSMEALVVALVDEIIKESDNLLGNSLIATHDGNIRDASVISYKRSEVLEKALKAMQAKQIFEKENGIDVDSPSMRTVFLFFMTKVKGVFAKLKYDDEASDLFFTALSAMMHDWKKELKQELEDQKVID